MYYRSLNAYLRETFGCKVYKLALSAGCTCPNRDGTLDARGCIFCSGSGEFAASAALPVSEQLAQAKRLVAAKAGPDARYIAYFQDYSNTYAPADQLRPLFLAAIDRDEICALSIATRPDCLPQEILGCPLRMVLRLAGGDLNAVVGLAGFAAGIFLGTIFIRKGFTLQRNYATKTLDGTVLPAVMVGLLILFLAVPTLFKLSEEGPGSKHAPFLIALLIALVVGALAQKSRICMVGGLRDTMMFKDLHLLWGFIAIFVTVLIGNLCLHKFNLGFAGQPVAHSDHVWNFLGMLLAGWGSVLLGGCPLRQLILAGSGNADSAVTVFGMIVGAAFAHNFGLAGNAASESSAGGVSTNGRVAVVLGIVIVLVISIVNSMKKQEAQKNG